MISSQNLSELCPPNELRKLMISLAVLDEIMSPEWEYRYYSFDPNWAENLEMASMRNGSGDEFFIVFSPVGTVIKGFAHESPMSPYRNENPSELDIWPGIYDQLPGNLRHLIDDPALEPNVVTYCIWWETQSPGWKCGVHDLPLEHDPDGSQMDLQILNGNPLTYQMYAREYYDQEIPVSFIEAIYRHSPFSKEAVLKMNSKVNFNTLLVNMRSYGYGSAN